MTEKKVWLEWTRVIAVVLVLFNHLPGFSLFMDTNREPERAIAMLRAMFVRVNVPLFFMVSGAVLLGKKESCRATLIKRSARIAAVIALFSLGLYLYLGVYYTLYKGVAFEFTPRRFLRGLLAMNLESTETYWFLYAYLSYTLLLPFLRRVAAGMDRPEFCLLLGLHALVCSLLPICNLLLASAGRPALFVTENLTVPLAAEKAFFYPLLGYYLDTAVDIRRIRRSALAGIALAGAAGLAAACLCTYREAAYTGVFGQSFVTLFDYIAAIAAFLLIKRLVLVTFPALGQGKIARRVCLLGSLTFGVYLLEPYFKVVAWAPYLRALSPVLHAYPLSLLWLLAVLPLSAGIVWLLKKLPVLRRLL